MRCCCFIILCICTYIFFTVTQSSTTFFQSECNFHCKKCFAHVHVYILCRSLTWSLQDCTEWVTKCLLCAYPFPTTNKFCFVYSTRCISAHTDTQVHCVQPASMFFWTLRNCDAVSIARRAWNSLSAVNRKRIIILFLRLFLFKYLCQVSSKNPLQMRGLELEQREDLQMTLHVRIKISVYINVGRGQWKGIKPCYGIVFWTTGRFIKRC